ncbi:DivIVA domain-containing protein [Nocardiopsis flavescens]|uniref:DivIVA domain-containing protein n=1 Tax=Nocardiopsis flavescens TaxID=758803 RepID=A0A1M6UV50_9ACTN|nr:DivIVA domain-containing protein [Nocardiopsis flavescens]SHK73069.1 DivIVA domain-containing protein [Nocardiopsis flavescens]
MNSPLAVPDFDIILRGYDRVQVTDLLHRAIVTLAAGTGERPRAEIPAGTTAVTAAELASARFDVVLRGYDRTQVAGWIEDLARDIALLEARTGNTGAGPDRPARDLPAPESPVEPPRFDVVLRGYDRVQVSGIIDRALATLTARTGTASPVEAPAGTTAVTAAELASARFDVVLRGYDRVQVDAVLDDLAQRVARSEERGGRE